MPTRGDRQSCATGTWGVTVAEIMYRGCRIVARSFLSGVVWRTEVTVWRDAANGGWTETMLYPPPAEWSATSEAEANEYGFAMGRVWIDRAIGP